MKITVTFVIALLVDTTFSQEFNYFNDESTTVSHGANYSSDSEYSLTTESFKSGQLDQETTIFRNDVVTSQSTQFVFNESSESDGIGSKTSTNISSVQVSTPSSNTKSVTSLKILEESTKIFSLDVASLLIRTNRVSLVRGVNSSESDIFQQDFLRRISYQDIVSFIELDSNRIKRCQKCNATDEQSTWTKLLTLKHIIIVLYDTNESLNKSLVSEDWSIFKESPRSFYVFVITSKMLSGVDCSMKNFDNVLIEGSKNLFTSIWNKFQILETVIYFPYLCDRDKILKFNPVKENSVNILSTEDIKNDPSLLVQRYDNLYGYPLKVKLFGRVPTAVKNMSRSILNSYLQKDIERIGNVGGIDGFTLANMVKYLNFTVNVSEPADGVEYGYMNYDGIYVGTLGDVIYKRADISFNGRFLKNYDAKDIEFTMPIYHDQFCVLVPKSLRIPTWLNIFLGFSVTAWYMIVLTACVSGVLWWLMKVFSLNPEPGSKGTLGFCIHFMDMCLLIASQPIFLPTLGRERIFVAGCLIFNIIFSGVFQGYLNTAFSTTSHYPDINTLDSLDKSGLPIATSSRLTDIFGSGSLQKKIKSLKTAAIDQAAEKRDVSAVERRSDARLLIELKYLAVDGEPLLHVVNECPRSYYLTYIVYKGYPFLEHMNRFIQRITEGGLNDQWYDFTMYSIVLHHRSNQHISSESLKKLTLVDVQTAFFALVIGLVSSFVVFVCEYLHFRIEERRKMKKKSRWSRLMRSDMFVSTAAPKYQFSQ